MRMTILLSLEMLAALSRSPSIIVASQSFVTGGHGGALINAARALRATPFFPMLPWQLGPEERLRAAGRRRWHQALGPLLKNVFIK